MAGDVADASATPAEAEAMLRAFGSAHKRLVLIPGARHVDLWSHDTAACTQALAALLHIL